MTNKIHLRTCIGVEYDLPLISPFIEHYKALGVDEFYITLSSPTEEHENFSKGKAILSKYDIDPFAIWIGPYREGVRNQYLHKMISHLSNNEWILTADCDEFQEYPSDLHTFSSELDKEGDTWVHGGVIDRVANGGEIPKKLDRNLTLAEQFPIKCNMHRLKPESPSKGGAIINNEKFMPKVMLHKKNITLVAGNHFPINSQRKNNKKHKHILNVNHFKWFGPALERVCKMDKDGGNQQGKHVQIKHLQKHNKINLDIVGID